MQLTAVPRGGRWRHCDLPWPRHAGREHFGKTREREEYGIPSCRLAAEHFQARADTWIQGVGMGEGSFENYNYVVAPMHRVARARNP